MARHLNRSGTRGQQKSLETERSWCVVWWLQYAGRDRTLHVNPPRPGWFCGPNPGRRKPQKSSWNPESRERSAENGANETIRVTLCENAAGALYIVNQMCVDGRRNVQGWNKLMIMSTVTRTEENDSWFMTHFSTIQNTGWALSPASAWSLRAWPERSFPSRRTQVHSPTERRAESHHRYLHSARQCHKMCKNVKKNHRIIIILIQNNVYGAVIMNAEQG